MTERSQNMKETLRLFPFLKLMFIIVLLVLVIQYFVVIIHSHFFVSPSLYQKYVQSDKNETLKTQTFDAAKLGNEFQNVTSKDYSDHKTNSTNKFNNGTKTEANNNTNVKMSAILKMVARKQKINKQPIPLKSCPLIPEHLVGPIMVDKRVPSMKEMQKRFLDVRPGGRFWPSDCLARFKVAIVIPYRNREKHLRVFLNNMHPFLIKQQLDYGIYVIEQAGQNRFNRAMLLNIGFVEAMKLYDYDCCIFHDIDLVPEDDRNLYTCPESPRHMSVAVDTMGYRLPYETIFGGVTALTKEQMVKVNGYSNVFFGWGGEDDDMYNRVVNRGKYRISRYSANIARYTMLTHKKDVASPERIKLLYEGQKRFSTDGLNSLKYARIDLQFRTLYTWVYVNISSNDTIQKKPK